jgi:hypothetical protein
MVLISHIETCHSYMAKYISQEEKESFDRERERDKKRRKERSEKKRMIVINIEMERTLDKTAMSFGLIHLFVQS